MVISHKFNKWYGGRANNWLKRDVAPGNVKIVVENV